jgi:hypothetical protein
MAGGMAKWVEHHVKEGGRKVMTDKGMDAARKSYKASEDSLNTGGGEKGTIDSANLRSQAAYHMEKAVEHGHSIYGPKDVTDRHKQASKEYFRAAGKVFNDKPKAEALKERARVHAEAAKSGEWDESKHPRDADGKWE